MEEKLFAAAAGSPAKDGCFSEADDSPQLRRNRVGLCLLNFLSADIRDGLGPFAAVFLLQEAKWRPHMIGIAMTANSVSQFCVQTPVGDFIDRTRHKKLTCAFCCVLRRHERAS